METAKHFIYEKIMKNLFIFFENKRIYCEKHKSFFKRQKKQIWIMEFRPNNINILFVNRILNRKEIWLVWLASIKKIKIHDLKT